MPVRYHDQSGYHDAMVSDVVVSAPILQFTHTEGQIGMWNHDSVILTDNDGDVTYTLRFYQDIDTDVDGIPDWLEVAGWWDGFGNRHFTDPDSADTDGDGLTDGEEAGRMVTVDGKIYFILVSDPNSVDGDEDGISDVNEIEFGTNALERDSDHDGLTDSYELDNGTDPCNPDSDGDGWVDGKDGEPDDAGTHEYSPQHAAAELVLGFILGAYGEENHDNVYYLIGSSLSGLVVIGDIRDAAVYISEGDEQMAAICLIGLVPTGGDGVRFAAKLGRHLAALSVEEAAETSGKIVVRQAAAKAIRESGASEAGKVALLDEAFLGLGTRTVRTGVSADDVLDLVGDSTKTVIPTKTLGVAKHDTAIAWLEEGDEIDGWIHIRKKHITGEIPKGTLFPSSMTEDDVKNLIFETFENPIVTELSQGNILYYHVMVPPNGQYIRVITNPDGKILSAYMVKTLPAV